MLAILQHRFTPRIAALFAFEIAALNALIAFSVQTPVLALTSAAARADAAHAALALAVSCTLVVQFVLWSVGLYSPRVVYCGKRVWRAWSRALLLVLLAVLPLSGAVCASYRTSFDTMPWMLALGSCGFLVVVAADRYVLVRLFGGPIHYRGVLIVGNGQGTRELIGEVHRRYGDALKVVGVLSEEPSQVGRHVLNVPVLGTLAGAKPLVRDRRITTILVSAPYDHPDLPVDFLLQCKLAGIKVVDSSEFYERISQKVLLEKLNPFLLLFPKDFSSTRLKWALKTGTETALAAVLLALSAVPFALVALAIRVSSPGPVIYRQRRVGKGGKPFTMYKFRTMREDAEAQTGAVWAAKNDSRTTAVGRWLRRLRVDELPQLVNILKGDMAFIGPRPERPEFVEELAAKIPFYEHRHLVKPGLTGWAQVAFSYAASVDASREKLRYDLYYVKHMSAFFDLLILASTVKAVVRGRGLS